ncbi:MAG: NUDIX domain-containing protein [Actinomycetota bacterium]|nr:NUDIX domain-containing protein [Actinomycetota bacterium]
MSSETPTSNPRVRITDLEVLSDNWYTLRKATFEFQGSDGKWRSQQREAYDRGNGAAALLCDPARGTIILTRQFRMPAYLNGHTDGMLLEVPAGLLDGDDAATAMRRELEEETGHQVGELRELFDVYMSPGSVTERLAFFYGTYSAATRVCDGGGHQAEGEDIEVVEITLDDAAAMIGTDIRDAKTVMLIQWALLNLEELR